MAFGVSEELKIVVKAEVDKAVKGLKEVQGTAGGIEKNIKSLGMAAVKYLGPAFLAGAVLKAGKAAVMAAASYEQLKVSLEVLLGSATKAEKLFASLREFAVKTPLQLDQLARSASTLMSFGTAAENVVGTLKNLGNLAQGMPDKLNRLVLAYGKVQAKGKATLEELNMFTEAGVPLMAELAKQIGLTREELFEYVSAGKVGFAEVDAAVKSMTTGEGQFASMLERQSETLMGLFSTAQDAMTNFAAILGDPTLSPIKDIVTEFTNVVNRIGDAITNANSLALVLQDVEGLSDQQKLAANQAQQDYLSNAIFGVTRESDQKQLWKPGEFRFASGLKARTVLAITNPELGAFILEMNKLTDEQRMFELQGLKQMEAMLQAKATVAERTATALTALLPTGGTGAGFNSGAGGTGIDYGAFPFQQPFIGPQNSPYNFATAGSGVPEGDMFGAASMAVWAKVLVNEVENRGPGAVPWTQGGITSPLASQFGQGGAFSPFAPNGMTSAGPGFTPLWRMNQLPIPEGGGLTGKGKGDVDGVKKLGEVAPLLIQIKEAAKQAGIDLEAMWDTIAPTIADAGIDAFMQLGDAIGYSKDALGTFVSTLPAMAAELIKIVGLQIAAGAALKQNWGMVAVGLGLAFGGSVWGGYERRQSDERANGGGSSGGGAVVNVEIHGAADAHIEGVAIAAINKVRTGYK